jgi:ferrous iron transport protein B
LKISSAECHSPTGPPRPFPPRTRLVAIVGPPNAGKSTLFNRLTGLHQKVANYPGVTVEHRMGRLKTRYIDTGITHHVELVDLPGIYSLNARSEDERVTRDVLAGLMTGMPRPDAVLLILDSTNLGRQLMLAAPVLATELPTMVLLNMSDDLARRGGVLNVPELSKRLGSPVALIAANTGKGFDEIYDFLNAQLAPPRPVQLPILHDVPKTRKWSAQMSHASGYVPPSPTKWTRRLDKIFLNPIAGPIVFLTVVLALFQSIFTLAKPMMNGIGALVSGSGHLLETLLPASTFRDLLVQGVWGGVGAVVVFLPQILLLFLFIGFLEDSGYLARAALIADRTMKLIGLQGKSFIPLISAYACAIPAVLAARTIENKRDRMATILIAPLMTCSARLPVYTLIIAAFIPEKHVLGPLLGMRALAMLSLYILGFLAAVATARVLKSSILRSERTPFILEMPPYRWPKPSQLAMRLIDRGKVFLHRAGTLILAVSVILWILLHVPTHNGQPPEIEHSIAGDIGHVIEPAIKPIGLNWKFGVGLISSLAARETIIGTLGTIYGTQDSGEENGKLQAAVKQDLTPAGAAALLIFFAFALQCMSTIAVVRRETAGWKWPAIQFTYMLVLAYVGAFAAYHVVNWW